jgi:hypothetical protein
MDSESLSHSGIVFLRKSCAFSAPSKGDPNTRIGFVDELRTELHIGPFLFGITSC